MNVSTKKSRITTPEQRQALAKKSKDTRARNKAIETERQRIHNEKMWEYFASKNTDANYEVGVWVSHWLESFPNIQECRYYTEEYLLNRYEWGRHNYCWDAITSKVTRMLEYFSSTGKRVPKTIEALENAERQMAEKAVRNEKNRILIEQQIKEFGSVSEAHKYAWHWLCELKTTYPHCAKHIENNYSLSNVLHYWAEYRYSWVDLASAIRAEVEERAITYTQKKYAKTERDNFYTSREWLTLRYEVFRQHKKECMVCGRTRTDGIQLHVDHIKPRSKYPELALSYDNLQILCNECNLGKSNLHEDDWRE